MDYKEAIEELESLHRHCSDMINEFDPDSVWRADCKALDVAISAMQELQEYKAIGTLKEVRKAVEKQKEERPIAVLGTFGGEEYECKNCGSPVDYMDDYCKWCGKAQDWSGSK